MYNIYVEVDVNSISIVFDSILEYGFGVLIIPEGMTIILLSLLFI